MNPARLMQLSRLVLLLRLRLLRNRNFRLRFLGLRQPLLRLHPRNLLLLELRLHRRRLRRLRLLIAPSLLSFLPLLLLLRRFGWASRRRVIPGSRIRLRRVSLTHRHLSDREHRHQQHQRGHLGVVHSLGIFTQLDTAQATSFQLFNTSRFRFDRCVPPHEQC